MEDRDRKTTKQFIDILCIDLKNKIDRGYQVNIDQANGINTENRIGQKTKSCINNTQTIIFNINGGAINTFGPCSVYEKQIN
jgi:hypothetical protein